MDSRRKYAPPAGPGHAYRTESATAVPRPVVTPPARTSPAAAEDLHGRYTTVLPETKAPRETTLETNARPASGPSAPLRPSTGSTSSTPAGAALAQPGDVAGGSASHVRAACEALAPSTTPVRPSPRSSMEAPSSNMEVRDLLRVTRRTCAGDVSTVRLTQRENQLVLSTRRGDRALPVADVTAAIRRYPRLHLILHVAQRRQPSCSPRTPSTWTASSTPSG